MPAASCGSMNLPSNSSISRSRPPGCRVYCRSSTTGQHTSVTRLKSMTQLVCQVRPASPEKACSQRAASGPELLQKNRTRIIRPW